MVQIPTYEARVGLETPSYPTVRVDDSVGQGLRALGNSISGVAEHIQAKQKQKASFDAAMLYDKTNLDLNQSLVEQERSAPADGSGLHDTFVQKALTPKLDAALASIQDPDLKKEYQQRFANLREKWSSEAANREYDTGNKFSLSQLQGMQESRLRGIAQDPSAMQSYVAEVERLADTAPNLTTAQREEFKTKFRETAPGVVAEALRSSDREALRFTLGGPDVKEAERVAFLAKRLTPAVEAAGRRAVSPQDVDRLGGLVGKYHGDAEAALIAFQAGPEVADKWLQKGRDYAAVPDRKNIEPYVQTALANLGPARLAGGPRRTGPSSDTLQAIRSFESFRPTAYWDVNAWRTGYGSDTVTRADGTVERVTRDTVVTREDAERDLARRTKEFQNTTIRKIGADKWANLSGGAKAALTSMAYNYGEIPDSVAAAARTGDPASIALAIRARGGDNGGVNRGRRDKEAQMAVGGDAGQSDDNGGYVSVVFADMPVAELQRYRASVSTQDALEKERIKQQLDLLKVDVTRQMDDDVASIRQTGQGSVSPTDTATLEKNIAETYGLDRVAKYRDDRFVAQSIHEIIADAATAPDDVLDARLKAIEAQPGEGAGLRQQIASGAKADIEAIKAERKADPVGYVVRNNEKVQAAWRAFSPDNPSTATDAIQATIDAQKALGIAPDKIMPLPADKAQAVAAVVQNPELPADQRAATLLSTILLTPDVDQQRQIISQMVKAGLPPKISNVVEAYSRGDTGATMRLFQAAMIDPDKAPKLGSNDNTLTAAVEDAMLGSGTIGRVFYGFDLGDPRSATTAASDLDLAKTAARLSMASGMNQETAVKQAVDDIFGKVDVLDRDLPSGTRVQGLVDQGGDSEAIARGLDKASGKVMDAASGYIARAYGLMPPGLTPEQEAVFRASRTETATRIFANGVWRNNGNGWSFFDTEHRAFIGDADGKPLIFPTDEILKMGQGGPSASVTPPAIPGNAFNPQAVAAPDIEGLRGYLRGLPKPSGPSRTPPSRSGRRPTPAIPAAPGPSLQDQLKADQSTLMNNGPLRDPSLRSPVISKSPGG